LNPQPAPNDSADAVQRVLRQSYGRLVAWLTWQWRDIAAAEDALSEAFAKALQLWPVQGVPDKPEAWLLATAKSRLLMAARHHRVETDPLALAILVTDEAAPEQELIPDHRLRLMYVCTHPAIEPSMRCALMLQTVLGLEAQRIASAFLVSPEAMTKRLVRLKSKIRLSGIRFEEPSKEDLADRSDAVLEAIYAAYSLELGYSEGPSLPPLADEAMYLAELLAAMIPDHAEAHGLQALLSFCEARRSARMDAQGQLVPLDQQDCELWNSQLIEQGNACLQRAVNLAHPGPYQYEAAIQAAHCQRLITGQTPWAAIARLYENLLKIGATEGARIGYALSLAQAQNNPSTGLALLDAMTSKTTEHFASWWAAKAHLLAQNQQWQEAAQCYEHAHALTSDVAQKAYLQTRKILSLQSLK
jgi:RNA polymerase sigma-70 factor, ECF subfamily